MVAEIKKAIKNYKPFCPQNCQNSPYCPQNCPNSPYCPQNCQNYPYCPQNCQNSTIALRIAKNSTIALRIAQTLLLPSELPKLSLLPSELPKPYRVLAILRAIGLKENRCDPHNNWLKYAVKPVLNGHLKKDSTKVLIENGSLMKGESIPLEHSAILLTCIKW